VGLTNWATEKSGLCPTDHAAFFFYVSILANNCLRWFTFCDILSLRHFANTAPAGIRQIRLFFLCLNLFFISPPVSLAY